MAEPAPTLRQLWAVHEIQQLAYRYAHAFAVRDEALMRSLGGGAGAPQRMPVIDRHRIDRDLLRWWDALGPCLLHVTNHVVELIDDDHARGDVHCLGQVEDGGRWVDQAILYRDAYVREQERWLFATREHRLWYGQARERHPLEQPPARWPHGQVGRGDLEEELDRAAVDRPGGAGDVGRLRRAEEADDRGDLLG